jgi:hypothetical protein
MEEHLGLQKFELVQNNVRIAEQQQTESLSLSAQEENVGEIADRALAENPPLPVDVEEDEIL